MTTTMRRLGLITGGVALFLVVVWYLALYSPQKHKLAAAHKARAAAEQQISTLNAQIVGLKALQKNTPVDTQKLAKYTAAVPDNPELPSALNAIQQAATSTGVTISNISPTNSSAASAGGKSGTSGTPAIPVSLNVTGSYPALTAFITALNGMPRTLVVQTINISGSGTAGGTLTASMAAEIFYSGQPTP